jgi:hypothetical protein
MEEIISPIINQKVDGKYSEEWDAFKNDLKETFLIEDEA